MDAVLETTAGSIPKRRGKVRDIYDLGDRLVLVATDRISAFDWILPTGIPDKGKLLTAMSLFWFQYLGVQEQILSTDLEAMGPEFAAQPGVFARRSVLVKKTVVVPIECVARGYLAGSAWSEYHKTGSICGYKLPDGLLESAELPEPLFTPATKAAHGQHDENIPVEEMERTVGSETTHELKRRTLELYRRAREYAAGRGLIVADTKFEFGRVASGELILVDEVLTPDSSRYWPMAQYAPGRSQHAFDKQFVRDWLESVGFDKKSPPPPLPSDVVENTRARYVEAYERLTGASFADYLCQ